MDIHETYMHRCIQLAKNGQQNARPNPMVGAVIVADGRIIGEGYHVRCGEGHAEVNAFAAVKPQHEHMLPRATLYVSLEPCCHYGKTPPCADLIVSKGVRRVVVGCIDPFAQVQGKGIERLRRAGIDVVVGVCEEECKALNKVFFTFHKFRRPYVTLKWAASADGFIAAVDAMGRRQTTPISNVYTQMLCHKLRAEHQAILVGYNTWTTDHPSLTTRAWYGRNPQRVLLTHHTELCHEASATDLIVVDGGIGEVLKCLHQRGIQSLLVEGGLNVLQQFIDSGLWDEAWAEQGETVINNGTKAPVIDYQKANIITFFGRTIHHYVNNQ